MGRKALKKALAVEKVLDETFVVGRYAEVREEVWQTKSGRVVKYNLAYINLAVFGKDNGRVLGYDNSPDYHHRHCMGAVEPFQFDSYEALAKRFYKEVQELRRREDEKG